MTNKILATAIGILFSCSASILHAEGTINAGKEKAASCGGCHGDNGNSAAPNFPKLAEQHASYVVKQLKAFKSGTRKDPMMSAMALALSDADMDDIGAYYAAQKISSNPLPTLPVADDDDEDEDAQAESQAPQKSIAELIARGSELYRNGDLNNQIAACTACHGSTGDGNQPSAFPLLKSQHADYLIKALNDFKSGARGNSPDNMMHAIAKKMSDEDIKAVAYHISVMK